MEQTMLNMLKLYSTLYTFEFPYLLLWFIEEDF